MTGSKTTTKPRESVWRWRFRSIAELHKALEEYTSVGDMELAPRIGQPPPDGGDPNPDEMDTHFRLMAQNREIDRRMLRLGQTAPLYHRLIDAYYRRGLCCEARGWEGAARRCGLPTTAKTRRGRDVSRPQFETVLDLAVVALFHAW